MFAKVISIRIFLAEAYIIYLANYEHEPKRRKIKSTSINIR
jgi:hypothetical protein